MVRVAVRWKSFSLIKRPYALRNPASVKAVRTMITSTVFHLDRIRVWVRSANPTLPWSWMRLLCSDLHRRPGLLPRKPGPWTQIDLFQPQEELLYLVAEAIPERYDYAITHAEVAIDFIVRFEDDASALRSFFLRHLVVPVLKQPVVVVNQETAYYARQGSPQNLKLHWDVPSKIANRPCLHIEWRLIGEGVLAPAGLAILPGLIRFDPFAFWRKRLLLVTPPSMSAVGQAIPSTEHVSRATADRHARRFLADVAQVAKSPVAPLQDVLRRHSSLAGACKRLHLDYLFVDPRSY